MKILQCNHKIQKGENKMSKKKHNKKDKKRKAFLARVIVVTATIDMFKDITELIDMIIKLAKSLLN